MTMMKYHPPTSSSADTRHPARRLAMRGLLLCLALVFSYLEAQLPLSFLPVPGIRLGFANLVVTFCAYVCDLKTALSVSVARVLITALLFGNWSAFWFSLCGALFAFALLALLLTFARNTVSTLGVSAACAAAHNTGQLLAAAVLMKSAAVFSYYPVLLIAGTVTGTLTGILMILLLRALPPSVLVKAKKGTP